jgi:CheY-like chemotaxis protein
VLVVEDDPNSANLISLYLGRGGYQTELATDGQQALEKARRLQPMAITLDIMLPRLDGWEVLRALKLDEQTHHIPVLVVSIMDNEELGYALGADDYFVKPVERRALLDRLSRYASANGAARGGLKVLIVDDEPSAVDLLAAMLGPTQHQVIRAGGGAEGIARAREDRPDVILLDLMMPEVSGFEVISTLRADPATENVPILVITAKDITGEEKKYLNGHVAAVLQKNSVGSVQLLAWLDDILKRLDAAREVAHGVC